MIFVERLKDIILEKDFNKKVKKAKELSLKEFDLSFEGLSREEQVFIFEPGRPEGFQIVEAKKVPIRKNLKDRQHKIHFVHAIANIELLAIELPLLALLRFGWNDRSYLENQIQIIREEASHFSLLKNRLYDWGVSFGSLPVHHSLWNYAWQCHSLLEHQVIIPCYLEARGLDVCPEFVLRFKEIDDELTASYFQRILDDEVRHVQFGLKWLQKEAHNKKCSVDQLYTQTLSLFFKGQYKSRVPLNHNFRQKAGFSQNQINFIS